ncbi:hypothetical protein MY9_3727 [Bacillus sp. JS]|nr:hypothetical protein MY9_3727 [Bacillus sp. JS]
MRTIRCLNNDEAGQGMSSGSNGTMPFLFVDFRKIVNQSRLA